MVVVGLLWMVGGDTVYNNSLIFQKEGSKRNSFVIIKQFFFTLTDNDSVICSIVTASIMKLLILEKFSVTEDSR